MKAPAELKICGLTTIADLRIAAQVGASFFGCVVEVPRSPRSVTIEIARYLGRAATLPQVCVVETADSEWVAHIAKTCAPAAMQLHPLAGAALAEMVTALPHATELWLAVGIPPRVNAEENASVDDVLARIHDAANAGVRRIVLDTATKRGTGGTGTVSDWAAAARIVQHSPLPILLAGGITPENVAEAAMTVKPYGIDVSSGIERLPGLKDVKKAAELMYQLRRIRSDK